MKRVFPWALFLVFASCRLNTSGLIVDTGTVLTRGGDCTGTWMVHSDSGHDFELTNLAAEFQRSELRVRFTLKPRNDVVSGCMAGASADVVAMTKL